MVISWFSGSKEESVEELIARKRYRRAVELLLDQFKQGNRDPRVRMQLADVLVLSGKPQQAVPILKGLADEYALEGFAGKAIAVLKKIEKIEPGRKDVGEQLANLIEKKKESTPSTLSMRAPEPPSEMLELGMEEVAPPTAPLPTPSAEELTPQPVSAPAPAQPSVEPGGTAVPDAEETVEDELLGTLEETLEAAAPAAAPGGPARAAPAMASPLFSDFSHDELLAVIHGLELLSFEAGDVIITEGAPGDSLFILTTGVAKAFVKGPEGRYKQVRSMSDGAFFGEISILTGKPRTATVTAATSCELLELKRPQLETITQSHPRVWDILREFYEQRAGSH